MYIVQGEGGDVITVIEYGFDMIEMKMLLYVHDYLVEEKTFTWSDDFDYLNRKSARNH